LKKIEFLNKIQGENMGLDIYFYKFNSIAQKNFEKQIKTKKQIDNIIKKIFEEEKNNFLKFMGKTFVKRRYKNHIYDSFYDLISSITNNKGMNLKFIRNSYKRYPSLLKEKYKKEFLLLNNLYKKLNKLNKIIFSSNDLYYKNISEIGYDRKNWGIYHWFKNLAYKKRLIKSKQNNINVMYIPFTFFDLKTLIRDIKTGKFKHDSSIWNFDNAKERSYYEFSMKEILNSLEENFKNKRNDEKIYFHSWY
jgi:hypothetical protein